MSNLCDRHRHKLRPLMLAMRQQLDLVSAVLTTQPARRVLDGSTDDHVVDVHGTNRVLLFSGHQETALLN